VQGPGKAARPVSGWRYGALALPLAFASLPVYVLLPDHYARNFGTSLPVLGAVLLLTRLFDAFIDPLVGRWADALFRAGSRAPLAVMAGASASLTGGFAALWWPPTQPGAAQYAWLGAALVLTYGSFSTVSVIHQAWGARLGGPATARARIFAWREGATLCGVLLASVLPSLAGFGAMTLALLAGLAVGVALLGASGSRPGREPGPAIPAGRGDRSPWRDAAFRSLIGIYTVNGIAAALPATLLPFFVSDVLHAPEWQPVFLATYFLSAVLAMPAWVRAVRFFGLASSWLLGMILSVATFFLVPWLGSGDAVFFAFICAASGAALGADLALPGALLAGVARSAGPAAAAGGVEGRYFGWWTCAGKLSLALAAGAALPLLSLVGYFPGTVSVHAVSALGFCYGGLPCGFKLVAAGWLWHARRRHGVLQGNGGQ